MGIHDPSFLRPTISARSRGGGSLDGRAGGIPVTSGPTPSSEVIGSPTNSASRYPNKVPHAALTNRNASFAPTIAIASGTASGSQPSESAEHGSVVPALGMPTSSRDAFPSASLRMAGNLGTNTEPHG